MGAGIEWEESCLRVDDPRWKEIALFPSALRVEETDCFSRFGFES